MNNAQDSSKQDGKKKKDEKGNEADETTNSIQKKDAIVDGSQRASIEEYHHDPPFAHVVESSDLEEAIPTNLERNANGVPGSSDESRTPGAIQVEGRRNVARRESSTSADSSSLDVMVNAELVEIDEADRTNGDNDEEKQKVVTAQAEPMASPIRILLRSRTTQATIGVVLVVLVSVVVWAACRGANTVVVVDEEGSVIGVGEEDELECLLYGEDC